MRHGRQHRELGQAEGLGEEMQGSVVYLLCNPDELLKWEYLFPFP